MGSPAAAHSLCGDGDEKVLVGTVCNEIYEVDFSHSSQPPMCYVQSHYDELWGLATHPSRQEFCTTSEDGTLRLWDLGSRTMKAMAKLPGPGRSCAYSADGRLVAVGLGGGGFAKGKPSQHDGQWLLLDAESLQTVASPPHKRKERIACWGVHAPEGAEHMCTGENGLFLVTLIQVPCRAPNSNAKPVLDVSRESLQL